MMKKLLLVIVGGIIFILLGAFTVDMGQVAITLNIISKHEKQYNPGIHFAWPLIENIDYVYMNNRECVIAVPINFSESEGVKVDVLANWHVVDPLKYLHLVNRVNEIGFDKLLTADVVKVVHNSANNTTLAKFNQLTNLLSAQVLFTDLGISLDKLAVVDVEFLSTPEAENNANATLNQGSHENEQGAKPSGVATVLYNENNIFVIIESAYYTAQQIKHQTEIKQLELYNQIKNENPEFYNYFRLIDAYKTGALTKTNIPPFKQLYK